MRSTGRKKIETISHLINTLLYMFLNPKLVKRFTTVLSVRLIQALFYNVLDQVTEQSQAMKFQLLNWWTFEKRMGRIEVNSMDQDIADLVLNCDHS